jgi:Mg/Co/Ni transporter MgtE
MSWLVVFSLVTWSLAAGYFPGEYVGWAPAAYWAVGAVRSRRKCWAPACFLVADDGHLRGLLTLHEVKAVPRDQWPRVKTQDVMAPLEWLASVGPQEELLVALERIDDANVAQMPVVAGDRLLGMIGREQILHYVRTRAELDM